MTLRIMSVTRNVVSGRAIRRAGASLGLSSRSLVSMRLIVRSGRTEPPLVNSVYASATSSGVSSNTPSVIEG